MDSPSALVSPSKLELLRKDARRLEHSIERSLNDFNRKLLLLKASGSTLVSSGGGSSVEQQPLIQTDAFADAEAAAADIELELQARALLLPATCFDFFMHLYILDMHCVRCAFLSSDLLFRVESCRCEPAHGAGG
jgi:hypothetical protein